MSESVTMDTARFAGYLDEFGAGWMAGDAKRMAAVFTEDGVFVPDPFGRDVAGRSAIEAYWRDIPMNQSEIAFRVGEIFPVGPWFAAEFRCTYRRRRTGEPVDVRGAFFCETGPEGITEMRMYHHRVIRDAEDVG